MAGETFIGQPWRQPYTAQQLQAAAEHQVPIVGSNGNWWRWDIDTSDWVDTGVTVATSFADSSVTWPKLAPEARKSNPNLLDNAYFIGGGSQQGGGQFPINQRGLTEYTGAGYTIDRWLINVQAGKLSVVSDGVVFEQTEKVNNAFMQRFDDALKGNILGKEATLSFLVDTTDVMGDVALTGLSSDGRANTFVYKRFSNLPGGIQLLSGTGILTASGNGGVGLYLYGSDAGLSKIKIHAAKLELGPHQTLAYESAGGVDPN